MKTLFLNPPSFEDFDGGAGSRYQATREVTSFWYPTWLCYPAGLIKDSRLVDAPAEHLGIDEVLAIAKDFELIVIYTSTPSINNDISVAEKIKDFNKDTKIVFVGPHPSALPEETLKSSNAIDIVAKREFDYSIMEIAQGKKLNEIDGISYKSNGNIVHNQNRKYIEDLDSLPFVVDIYKRDLNINNYIIPYLLKPYVSIYTGRGCSSKCVYCLWPQTFSGNYYRVRSVDNVIEEVKRTLELYPEVKEIFFDDDTFTANKKRARELSGALKELNITWSTTSRANTDYETLKMMKDSGLRLLVVGYESGNQEILNNIRKGITLDQAREFTKICKQLGIMIHGAFILGLPEETHESINDSIKFACELDVDTIQVSLASPYPGTQLYDLCIEKNYLVKTDMVNERGWQTCSVQYPGISSVEIFKSVERFYKKFYYRPRFILKILKKIIFNGVERRKILREGSEFKKFIANRKKVLKGIS
ncbi:MAG: hopanoid biosynthesis associated radical SAM protein HpnJ [Candidatus Scalindua sp.]|nr:hopanoid biosynthesis associated radical SAM protein HpnJ [Candidatus Scalindua sp.]MCR4344534.1 hopanoid biosynthesis associated radical SAM protein HpnJ [Candidatus Scalindua sp.]